MDVDDGQARDEPAPTQVGIPGVADPAPKRSRGRPAIGKASPVRLSDDEHNLACELGAGRLAEGVRHALQLVLVIGLDETRKLLGLNAIAAGSPGAQEQPGGLAANAMLPGAEGTLWDAPDGDPGSGLPLSAEVVTSRP
ncbi:hypothetical protein QRD43_20690 [Pelomonas sp. APW6]|uniref:Uncharacterized protein n=1 Tax=Roseateles subflavus TaxID=3053353 RepID=A0ABT7LQ34_9BURK|nr:hypothetical protein [Pelomonas sp. APW6]MDL5034332.1 hypothetical protein [Pelomonas sp. APW6]